MNPTDLNIIFLLFVAFFWGVMASNIYHDYKARKGGNKNERHN
jgi:hypothetical protein